ncbi:MAG: response regulator [Dehalococcoidia bacterium]
MTIRVVLADDEQLVRAGLRLILETESDIEVVGEASNGQEAVALTTQLAPDVVLMDVQMPDTDGIAATQAIARLERLENSRVIILTTFDLDEYVYGALRAGASGFLLKRAPTEELVAGVRAVASGGALLAPSVTRRLIAHFTSGSDFRDRDTSILKALTEREHEVFEFIAQGLSNAEIADRLFLSEGTVKTHVKHVFDKLQARDRTQVVILAYELGVVKPRGS